MWPYLVFLFVIGIEILYITKGKIHYSINDTLLQDGDRIKKRICILICVQLILFTGLRAYTIGADTQVYLNALEYYEGLPKKEILTASLVWPYDFEIGYFMLTKICAWLGLNKTAFLLIIAVLIYIPIVKLIFKYSGSPYLSLLCYFAVGFYSHSAGIFRQMIAVSICWCSLEYIKQRKLWKFLLLILVAFIFHNTALIFLPAYFLWNIDLTEIPQIILIATAVCLLFGKQIMSLAVKLLPQYSGYMTHSTSGGTYLMLAMYLMIYLVYVFISKYKPLDQAHAFFVNCIAAALLLQAASYSVSFFGRAIYYYSLATIILIPNLPFIGMRKKDRVVTLLAICVILFALVFLQFYDDERMTPYRMFFMT